MLTIREVTTKRDMRRFANFPLKLYKNCKQFTPPIYSDELKLLGGNPAYRDVADSVLFIAERDGRIVGRIQGIIQHVHNEIHNEKRIRFSRFDSIDDTAVSRALFSAVEKYGRDHGMTEMCGPLGYSDLDREGLLVEGFEYEATFEEQYNYDYYPKLVEDAGLSKEVDWLEFRLFAPDHPNEFIPRIAERVLKMNGLHMADMSMPKKDYIKKYADSAFECINRCYSHLYGTVPFTESMKRDLIDQFLLILNNKHLVFICDKDERVIALALSFPSIGSALRGSGGRLTPMTFFKLLRSVKKPHSVDLGLIAVLPEYQNVGVNAVLLNGLLDDLCSGRIAYYETNLNLETNTQVMAQWKYFKAIQHKRRRAYLKKIN